MMKRSLGQTIFFAIFGTFGRYVTNLRGTFVENIKKINPPYSTIVQKFQKREVAINLLCCIIKDIK
jgi:hypothetical protein